MQMEDILLLNPVTMLGGKIWVDDIHELEKLGKALGQLNGIFPLTAARHRAETEMLNGTTIFLALGGPQPLRHSLTLPEKRHPEGTGSSLLGADVI